MSRSFKPRNKGPGFVAIKPPPIDYSTKDDFKYIKPVKPDYLKPNLFRPFQSDLLKLSSEPQNKIIWIYDLAGGTGKSEFMNTIVCLNPVKNIQVTRLIPALLKVPLEIKNMFIDLCESKEDINYNILYSLQDGKWSAEEKTIEDQKKNLFVFANFMPKFDPLLKWRYQIYKISDEFKLN